MKPPAAVAIAIDELRAMQTSDAQWALLDVRELGEAERGHIPGATFLPRRSLEWRLSELVPARSTTLVLYDEGGERAAWAAQTCAELGYRDVRVLAGGLAAWCAAGGAVASGSNVPSKSFGERVAEERATPHVAPAVVDAWRREGAVLLLDIRTPEEYAGPRIPEALSAPGFDVAFAAGQLAGTNVPVVVNCAGRTRSIIACETLRELGVDAVYALENGTMGWVLAGLDLEKGEGRGVFAATPQSRATAAQRARALAHAHGVGRAGAADLAAWLESRARGERNLYVFDARQLPEYQAGHVAGSAALPGALAVQRTDEFIPVRRGRVVFIDDDGVRANLAAAWLARMGLPDVWVLEGGIEAWRASGRPLESGRAPRRPANLEAVRTTVTRLAAPALAERLAADADALVIDVGTSRDVARAHLAGATWIPRGWLEARLGAAGARPERTIVVTARDEAQSVFAAASLQRLGYERVVVLEGGTAAAGELPIASGLPAADAGADDVILPPYAKGEAGMREYLAWELALTKPS